ncbi:hypothetical protein B14911_24085 [Bacillus sp. NRRL B-14911]|nr:hypothetical protein B14911_24085 [Bacillus sp. NRRL B-14911]
MFIEGDYLVIQNLRKFYRQKLFFRKSGKKFAE